ncbi:CGNR zinc finger domain-containing protein [Nonomuraea sp. NPDC049152]|uniref:CGNR zinc finger domain-containing protein n=1 Tax=Nonomuraea sp. NPDC049152 TaxID=3154350 RepID=UPI0033C83E4A
MKIPVSEYTVGAVVATDLVNTSPTVRATAGEALTDPGALAGFLAEHGLRLDAMTDERSPTSDDLHQVCLLRREVRVILETATEDHAVAGAIVLVRRAGLGPVLQRDADGRWQWYVPTAPGAPLADELATLVGTALLGVVRALGHERFRPCAALDCRGVFVDISRPGRRRYCSDLCGNRLNVANHRARLRVGSVAR